MIQNGTIQSAMFQKLAARDSAIIGATALLWWAFADASAGRGMLADFVGLLVGLAVGASIYLLHEWGHTLGGLLSGSVVHANPSLRAISLFSFDSKRNSRSQFAIMSLSGFAVTALAVLFSYGVLPDGLLASRVARGAAMVLASLTLFVEAPILVAGLVRSEIPAAVEVFTPEELPADEGAAP